MKINIYVRGASGKDKSLIIKIMTVAQIENYEIIDLNTNSLPESFEQHIGIAFGKTTARLAGQYTSRVYTLPTLDKLDPKEENKIHRTIAWNIINDIKEVSKQPRIIQEKVEEVTEIEVLKEWEYIIMCTNGKRICLHKGTKPHLESSIDAYLSKEDCRILRMVKEIFKAKTIVCD